MSVGVMNMLKFLNVVMIFYCYKKDRAKSLELYK